MVYVILLLTFLPTHLLAFAFGRRIGAKEGIDYCFEQYEKKLHD